MRHKARDNGGKYALLLLSAAILVYCSVRDWTRICYVIDTKISGFTLPHVMGFFEDLFLLPLWRADLKMSGYAVEFAGCMWTEAISEMKKLRIQQYPDTCGRGLRKMFRSKRHASRENQLHSRCKR